MFQFFCNTVAVAMFRTSAIPDSDDTSNHTMSVVDGLGLLLTACQRFKPPASGCFLILNNVEIAGKPIGK